MKRIICLALVMTAALCACGEQQDTSLLPSDSDSVTTPQDTTTELSLSTEVGKVIVPDPAVANILASALSGVGRDGDGWLTECCVVDEHEELMGIYDYVLTAGYYTLRYRNGGAYDDHLNGTYSEDFFDDSLLIAVATSSSSGTLEYDVHSRIEGDKLVIDMIATNDGFKTNPDGSTETIAMTADIGKYIFLVPVSRAEYENVKDIVVERET